jgi:ATP-dependent protease Clp ATPase subunit
MPVVATLAELSPDDALVQISDRAEECGGQAVRQAAVRWRAWSSRCARPRCKAIARKALARKTGARGLRLPFLEQS